MDLPYICAINSYHLFIPTVYPTAYWKSLKSSRIWLNIWKEKGFPSGSDGKEYAHNAGDLGLIPGLWRFPWRRNWQPTPVPLSGEFHGQRSLVDYSPWGLKRVGHGLKTTMKRKEILPMSHKPSLAFVLEHTRLNHHDLDVNVYEGQNENIIHHLALSTRRTQWHPTRSYNLCSHFINGRN